MSTSTVIFRHELNHSHKTKNGEKFTTKETIIDGEKGLSFMYLNKQGEKKFYRVVVKEESPNEFSVKEKKDEKETEKKMNMDDLTKLIKSDELKFVRDYIKNDRDNYRKALKGGKKRSSKKASKKRSSKKKSMKGGAKRRSSKKASKKRSSKKKSMKGGKRRSSKKASKKRSSKKKSMKGGKRRSSKKASKKRSSKKKSLKGGKRRSSKKASKKRSSKRKMKGFNTVLY